MDRLYLARAISKVVFRETIILITAQKRMVRKVVFHLKVHDIGFGVIYYIAFALAGGISLNIDRCHDINSVLLAS